MSDEFERNNQPAAGDLVLKAQDVQVRPGASSITATVHQGEIIGIAGLDGHGQEEFLEILCGLRKPGTGAVVVKTRRGTMQRVQSFRGAARSGIVYLPRDRKSEGIFPPLSVLDNFSVVIQPRSTQFGFLRRRYLLRRYASYREQLSIVAPSVQTPITSLSGGNQQKVLLARWMAASPLVMILNDPTRGVDLGTRLALHRVFRDAAEQSMALILLSTEIEELLQLCHRVLVFREGQVFDEIAPPAMTMSAIIAAMFGRPHEL
jgi:ribose transport system ATP-binding protein